MPALTQIPHYWAPMKEQALYMAILSCYMQLGIIFTMPVTGALCESKWEWPAAYYLHGTLCALLFTLFFIFYRDTPKQSWFTSDSELDVLEADRAVLTNSKQDNESQSLSNGRHQQRIPYKQMLTDSSMWACLSAGTGSALAYYFFALYGPTYMNKVLKVTVEHTGIFVAIPFVLAIGGKLLFGPGMDYIGIFTMKARIVWTTIIAQIFNVICYVILGIFPATSALLAQLLIIVVLVSNGVGFVGLARNAQVTAQQHSHFIMAILAMINSLVTLGLPLAISAIAGENTPAEWSLIFFIMAAILFALDIGFGLLAKTKPRPWTAEI
ncbi:major facilitator superfamily domain-containing protein [Ditylenchus destructor]|uniref:Major facilitator superfamily domain-containing protein n=1 Tax=Ditylenchus destructor TaxID=166010 RepID=A0AAD4MW86_9BILA|nr:major facilitator superfamily domain-containing protein [Ditylenchus destructor]